MTEITRQMPVANRDDVSLCPPTSVCQAMHMDADREVLGPCVELLGKFIGVKEPNIRYLGLVHSRSLHPPGP